MTSCCFIFIYKNLRIWIGMAIDDGVCALGTEIGKVSNFRMLNRNTYNLID